MPKSNRGFWENKLDQNRRRDMRNRVELARQGWAVLAVWECDISQSRLEELIVLIKGGAGDGDCSEALGSY
jgi:G:T-mismatch repair DNA endonuclease (very short patch repair protein)